MHVGALNFAVEKWCSSSIGSVSVDLTLSIRGGLKSYYVLIRRIHVGLRSNQG